MLGQVELNLPKGAAVKKKREENLEFGTRARGSKSGSKLKEFRMISIDI
jgi:hypothetical protein